MAQSKEDAEGDRTHLVGMVPASPAAAAPVERGRYLLVLEGLEPGRHIEMVEGGSVTFGRVAPCDVVFPDPELSRAHCRVDRRGNDVLVTDLNSTNGTFVNGKRIAAPARIAGGGTLRIGRQMMRHELRSRQEVEAAEALRRDLSAARAYVESLLPAPLNDGPVRAEWLFEPSARIGGDALGYHALDDDHFALYLMDVAGHGAKAALLAASVINVMRKGALPGVDMTRPGDVLRGLNTMFPMEEHGGMFFAAWYGVYSARERELRFACGGHHPGYLVGPDRRAAAPLETRNPLVGVQPGHQFESATSVVTPGSSLYLFSDGVFEVQTPSGELRDLDDFLPVLLEPAGPAPEPERLMRHARKITGRNTFEDDLTLLVATFP